MRLHSGAGKHTPHSVGPLLYCLPSAQPITKFKRAAITLFLLLSSDLASVCTHFFFTLSLSPSLFSNWASNRDGCWSRRVTSSHRWRGKYSNLKLALDAFSHLGWRRGVNKTDWKQVKQGCCSVFVHSTCQTFILCAEQTEPLTPNKSKSYKKKNLSIMYEDKRSSVWTPKHSHHWFPFCFLNLFKYLNHSWRKISCGL